ncbi:MAG: hypothetical protein DIU67_002015 [Actinomycetes bacterium]|jgi:cell division protein FtsL|nr:MAG: hypothetical protein DIU67_01715 [Actinomycetota bacterium]
MTAVVDPRPRQREQRSVRVIPGRKSRRPAVGPWLIVAIIAIGGFLGLGITQTSLDRAAFELAELNKAIEQAEDRNLDLKLQIARLESPARIAPLAEEMGLVLPEDTRKLYVDLDEEVPVYAEAERGESNQ